MNTTTASLALIFALLLSLIQAQSSPPLPCRRQSYTTANSKFYIQGGFTWQGTGIYTPQFYDLDLSASWLASSPKWGKLPNGPLISHHDISYVAPEHSAGLGSGKSGYIVAIGGTNQKNMSNLLNVYDIGTASWSVPQITPPFPALEGHSLVTNPNNGHIYIIGGYWNLTQLVNSPVNNSLTVFDPSTGTFPFSKTAAPEESLIDAQAVWSSRKNKVLVFGGSRANSKVGGLNALGLDKITEINPDYSSVIAITAGNVPNHVWDHCAAISDDGLKVYVFGGQVDTKVDPTSFSDDLYVLNVDSYVWTQLKSSASTRTRMSCGFHADQFFVWGGSVGSDASTIYGGSASNYGGEPIIYDIHNEIWISRYSANGTSTSSSPNVIPSDDTKTNLAPIIGGAAGGVVLIALVAYIVYLRKRQTWKRPVYSDTVVTNSIIDDEDDRINTHARKNRPVNQQYSIVDSDIDGSYSNSDRPLNKHSSFMMDQYNASAATNASHIKPSVPYQRPNIRSGYWEEGSNFSGQDANLRPLSGVSSAPTEGQFRHSRPPTELFNIPHPVSPPPLPWPSNQQGIYQQQHQPQPAQHPQTIQYQPQPQQIQQQLQQRPLQQQPWGGYAPSSFYQGIPDESMRNSFIPGYQYQVENANHPQNPQGSSASPQFTGQEEERFSAHESVSNFSDTRTNSSVRGPQSFPTATPVTASYVPPPSPST
ncbi:hypothetical protein BGZ76_010882 [Entomortierella beljakovae]|nr:hypothetical protein BGZ76_010882 [Entomortierella beljakovae]